MWQLNLRNCEEAMAFYQKAFDATIDCVYWNEAKTKIEHAEMRAFGQCLAFSEQPEEIVPGNTIQLCFHFQEGQEDTIRKAYDVLKEGALRDWGLGPCDWGSLIFTMVDKYGVYWCVFC